MFGHRISRNINIQFLPRCMECRLSVRQTRELWQNGKNCQYFYTIRKII